MLNKWSVFLISGGDIVDSYISNGHTSSTNANMGQKTTKISQSNGKANEAPKASNWVPIANEPVFTPRKIRVVCVGAGYAV